MTTILNPPSSPRVPVTGAAPTENEVRRSTAARGRVDVIVLLGAFAAAVSLAAIFATRIIPDPDPVEFTVIAYLLFLALYAVLVSLSDNALTVRDRVASVVIHGLAGLTLMALTYVVVFTFARGREALVHPNFYYQDMRSAGPLEPLTDGGILHAAAGTLIEITIALIITVPLGLACAVYLNEVRGSFPRFVRTIVEAMTALPSIVAGLFIYAAVIITFGVEKSGFALH